MGTRAVAIALTLASAAAAIVAVAPLASRGAQVLGAGVGVGLALHGLGRLCARGDDAPVAVVIAWGLAAYLALAGWLLAAGLLLPAARLAIGAAGLGAGVAWAWRRGSPPAPRTTRGFAVVALAAAAALAVATLAAAGAHPSGFDGDGHLLGALARLDARGALDDLIGYPRRLGLGGSVTLASLGVALPDRDATGAVDGGFALALAAALALTRIRRGDHPTFVAVVALLLVFGVPALPPALMPRWTTIALALALLETLARPTAPALATASIAAALATLGYAGAGAALVIIATARPPRVRVAALVAVGVAGYVIAAGRADGAGAWPWTAPGFAARAAAGVGAGVVAWALTSLALRSLADRALERWLASVAGALAVGLAAAPTWPTAALVLAPWLVALALVIVVDTLGRVRAMTAGLAIAGFAAVAIPGGLRFRLGVPPRSWGDHLAAQLDDLRAGGGRTAPAGARPLYRAAQAAIPPGATVAAWVDAPELLDVVRHRVIDLRSAAAAACVAPRHLERPPAATCRTLARQRATIHADYLLVSPAVPLPPDDPLAQRLTAGVPVATAGDLQAVAVTARTADTAATP